MASDSWGEIILSGVALPLQATLPDNNTISFPRKSVLGDSSKDSDPLFSTWIISNLSGGHGIEHMNDVARQLDGFVTKTITPLPREGNAPPRIAETAHGMLNAIGLANPGRERFLAEHLQRLLDLGVPIWVSVGGFSASDYAETCAALAGIEAIELNLSCPNVDEAADSAAEIVAAARAATVLPLYAKLSAAHPDVAAVARAVAAAGADGLSLVNTLPATALALTATLESGRRLLALVDRPPYRSSPGSS